ncbi:unnamed protein product [Clonostachys rhizophaga]|uniref:Uncharacterized protein n=1 Tax=Clonostachys rhizophaga TaxID=160324 RepID=A0A9N9VTN1_9HYPO|nr:unnamed protein product [Clonostachys rhizophaga]
MSVSVFRNTPAYPKDQGPCSRSRNIKFLRLILIHKPWLAKHVDTVTFGRFSTLEGQTKYAENWVNDPCPVSDYELGIFQHHIEYILGQCLQLWNGLISGRMTFRLNVISPKSFIQFIRTMSNSSYYFGSEWIKKEYLEMTIPLRNLQDVYHERLDEQGHGYFYNERSI